MSLNAITPQDILKFVNFNIEENNSWEYDENKKDMYSYQAEGSAGIYNRLKNYSLAILADEVGMGKTYQALSVVTKLFIDKPDSKVLIITPRYEVLRQWKNEEYPQFKEHHVIEKYRESLPKKEEIIELSNMSKGFFKGNSKETKLVFAKTTSFQINIDIDRCEKDLKKFDLVIVDEAHKFRNFSLNHHINKRTTNAHKIFSHLGVKILLMSATPLHSKKSDIVNIVNLFSKNIFRRYKIKNDADSIMEKLMIRRLRVMNKDYNKYHYRVEKELAVNLDSKNNDFKNELFFAMLQKKIIHSLGDINYSKSKNMLDLLEGTSFDDEFNTQNKEEAENPNTTKVFDSVVRKFKKTYNNQSPSNQKYNDVLNHIFNDEQKALVFVRRRASAIELARLYIDDFDKKAWTYLTGDDNYISVTRKTFDKSIQNKKIDSKVEVFIKKKMVLEYFDVYKRYVKRPKGTRDKTILKDMASSFFYTYQEFNIQNFEEFKKDIEDEINHEEKEDITSKLPKSMVLDFFKTKKNDVSTSASRFVKKFSKGKSYSDFFINYLPSIMPESLGLDIHTNKYGLIQSAILHSSFGVIELFKCDIKAPTYKSFCKNVSKIIDKSLFKQEIESFLKHFDKYEKYLISNKQAKDGEKDKDSTDDISPYKEDIFHNAQPAYAYLANTKNDSVIA
ncbi:MAG: DEAD/DEAH box helicase family protein, partial [Campylobacterota bacterium]|nr:DEAD/DEAH box helicase family protein [Campylobacterota bacterium]